MPANEKGKAEIAAREAAEVAAMEPVDIAAFEPEDLTAIEPVDIAAMELADAAAIDPADVVIPVEVAAIELILARLLRTGSLIAAALLAVGIGAMFAGQTDLAPKQITAGLLVLLCTPVMRVVAAGVIFVKEKDWHFACFSLVVLCAMAAGIYFGRGA